MDFGRFLPLSPPNAQALELRKAMRMVSVQPSGMSAEQDVEMGSPSSEASKARRSPRSVAESLAPGSKLSAQHIWALVVFAPFAGIGLILSNKALMDGFGFRYSGFLVALHFATNALVLSIMCLGGVIEMRPMSWRDRFLLGGLGAAAILLGNASLRVNSLGTFLATNMLTTPATVLLRFLWEGKRYPPRVLGALGLVITGVALHTLTDKALSVEVGLTVAIFSVVCNASYQLLQKLRQDQLDINAAQLLQQTSPLVSVLGLLISFFTEWWGNDGLMSREFSTPELMMLLTTAVFAVTSNVAAGALIGVTSPVTFQVTGYVKTCLLFLVSLVWDWLATPSSSFVPPPWGSLVGVPFALTGAVLYGMWVNG
jgi:solute carrier family 35, member E3